LTPPSKDAGHDLRYLAQLAIVCGAYFGLAKAGLEFAFANQSVTSVWPPTGLALAALVLWGQRMWPAVAVGAFLANITTAGPLLSVLGITTGNTLEAVVGAYLLTRVAGFNPKLERVKDVSALVLYAAVFATMISATIGVTSLYAANLVPDSELFSTWRTWWLGDMGGALTVAPALLVLVSRVESGWRPRVELDAIVLLVVLIGVSVVAFTIEDTMAYVIFPLLFWIAFRLHQPGTVVAGVIVSGIAIWYTQGGQGPFIGGSPDAELLRAQTFVGVATITGLLAAALISERRRAADQLRYLADHDELTGLLNRRRFTQELEQWFAYNSRYDVQGAVLVIDIDDFKEVNDALGHQAGDELIGRLGNLLRRRLRETDVVARWGGDEFTVLLPRASEEHAWTVASALLAELREEGNVTVNGRTRYVTVSIGVVPFGAGVAVEPRDILAHADAAMYGAKNAGRDQVKMHNGNVATPEARPGAESLPGGAGSKT
jgi:diguanylate cyclase (GGDEF)-like protein